MKIQKLVPIYMAVALLFCANLVMAEVQKWTCAPISIKKFPDFEKNYDNEDIPINFDYDTETREILSVRIFNYNNEVKFMRDGKNFRVIGYLDKEQNLFYILDWDTDNQDIESWYTGSFAISQYVNDNAEDITNSVKLENCRYTVLEEVEHKAPSSSKSNHLKQPLLQKNKQKKNNDCCPGCCSVS